MNNNKNPISFERDISLATEKVLKKSEKLPTTEEKITYLKKIISDCDRIINIAKKLDGEYLDVTFLKKEEQNIDEDVILFLEGFCKPISSLTTSQRPLTSKESKTEWHEKAPLVLRQPRQYYKVSLTDGDKVCEVQIVFGGVQSFKESIKDQITVIEAVGQNEEMTAINNIDTIKIETGISVIVRIFECMKGTRIIWSETPIKDIAGIFFNDVVSKIKFEKNYNAAKNRIEKEESSTNNTKLLDFILLLIEKSFKGKEKELEIIIKHTEELQKNII